jgi:hypothetical protein
MRSALRFHATASRHRIAQVTYGGTATPDATGHVRGSLLLSCVGCGKVTAPKVWNWPNYQFCELDLREVPEVPVYCPSCAERQFDLPSVRLKSDP